MKSINQPRMIEEEILSPKAYLNLNPKQQSNIANTKIIPAKIGNKGFGKIKVYYRIPFYRFASY